MTTQPCGSVGVRFIHLLPHHNRTYVESERRERDGETQTEPRAPPWGVATLKFPPSCSRRLDARRRAVSEELAAWWQELGARGPSGGRAPLGRRRSRLAPGWEGMSSGKCFPRISQCKKIRERSYFHLRTHVLVYFVPQEHVFLFWISQFGR